MPDQNGTHPLGTNQALLRATLLTIVKEGLGLGGPAELLTRLYCTRLNPVKIWVFVVLQQTTTSQARTRHGLGLAIGLWSNIGALTIVRRVCNQIVYIDSW